jgi:hypothetical protein
MANCYRAGSWRRMAYLPSAKSALARLSYVTGDNIDSQQDSGRGVAGAVERLATYGTLAPGRPNHHQLAGLKAAG